MGFAGVASSPRLVRTEGITGIVSGGNKAGDVVLAHGSALYRQDGNNWVPVVSGGHQTAAAPDYATNAPHAGAGAMLEAMRKVIDSVPKDAAPAERKVIEQELAAASAAIRARLARAADGYAIAAGPEHGQYLRFARALSEEKGVRMLPLVTRGGEENLRMLREGVGIARAAQGMPRWRLMRRRTSRRTAHLASRRQRPTPSPHAGAPTARSGRWRA
jgi:hypothetical protein